MSWLTAPVWSCLTPCWIAAYMMMVRVEYTCSFLLEGREKRRWFFCLDDKLLRLQAGLKASAFMASHFFLGLVLNQISRLLFASRVLSFLILLCKYLMNLLCWEGKKNILCDAAECVTISQTSTWKHQSGWKPCGCRCLYPLLPLVETKAKHWPAHTIHPVPLLDLGHQNMTGLQTDPSG